MENGIRNAKVGGKLSFLPHIRERVEFLFARGGGHTKQKRAKPQTPKF